MSIITISRQIAAYGDEVASALAGSLGYSFVNRNLLEQDLLALGLAPDKLQKYDERKPGFWASLARDRDEYFDFLRQAVLERAKDGNCVFIGRGGFAILKDVPGSYAVRLIASDSVRVYRLMQEFSWPEKKAQALMQESDENRRGFHKCFFNLDHDESSSYHLVINTDTITPETAAEMIRYSASLAMTVEQETAGVKRIHELLEAQKLVNHIVFELKLPVHFLEASSDENEIILHGVADSASVIESALAVARSFVPGKKITSAISIVQDYKSYP